MAAPLHMYLDLEDTVITPVLDGWPNVHLINVEKVRKFIAETKPEFVHIFSFAIHTEYDRMMFNTYVRDRLETSLGVKLNFIPTMDELTHLVCKAKNLSPDYVTFQDMCDFFSKHEAFRQAIQWQWRNTKNHGQEWVSVVLLDDAVINESWTWPDLQIAGRIINVDTL
jgi:hypothetical protein